MPKSKVKWFDAKKGYGFIHHPDEGADIFVHFSAIVSENKYKSLAPGAEVEFDFDDSEKGLLAKNVRDITVLVGS
ncbi:MAG TPA: cold shock domain-containing protein [Chlorobaculum sp.]|nr:cold shock domain-containing protein [Chlorobaculum sp.]